MELAFEPDDMGGHPGQDWNPCWFLVESGEGGLAAGLTQTISPVMAEGRA